jgi:hypothetical protein
MLFGRASLSIHTHRAGTKTHSRSEKNPTNPIDLFRTWAQTRRFGQIHAKGVSYGLSIRGEKIINVRANA